MRARRNTRKCSGRVCQRISPKNRKYPKCVECRRTAIALSVYAVIIMLGVIYLGEHYAVDVVAGVLVAVAAMMAATKMAPVGLSFRATVIVSAIAIAATALLVQLARAVPVRLF